MRLLPREPPPGPTQRDFWYSPLRGPWLTSLLGTILLGFVTIVTVTGVLSHTAYDPGLPGNAIVPPDGDLIGGLFDWPTGPAWLYAVNQGLHVTVGVVTVPLLLAKLWSVIPRLFTWPPVRSPGHALERLTLLGLVGGALFQFATGILNAQLYYPFHFNFVVAHYYGAWVFTACLVLHVATKLPVMRAAYRERGVIKPLLDDVAHTRPEPYVPDELAPVTPEAATLSRRGLLGLVGAASGGLLVVTAGQSVGGPLRSLALLAPRGDGVPGPGPNGFLVNKTAATARITRAMVGPGWQLELKGPGGLSLDRRSLLAMDLHEEELPIACVEGWSTNQHWTGVRLRDLAAMAGAQDGGVLHVVSLQPKGVLRQASLTRGQWSDDRSLLALKVNGADLSLDHGFPARIIVPGLPGVHNTKWVSSLEWAAA